MNTDIFVPLIFFILTLADARGPHHPRGEPIVKRHVHYRPTKDSTQKITQDAELLHDKEHIGEHLEQIVPKPDLSNMTNEELELYYFLVHDSDKNSKLDGLELLNAVLHTTHGDHMNSEEDDEDEDEEISEDNSKNSEENEFVELIDRVLSEDDVDKDGYLSYYEYVEGRKRSQNSTEIEGTPSIKLLN